MNDCNSLRLRVEEGEGLLFCPLAINFSKMTLQEGVVKVALKGIADGVKAREASCLERQFLSIETQIDLGAKYDFVDYLEPNEEYPSRIQKYLAMNEPGVIVSTGTERNFFNLALCDRGKCQGLVVVDINPKVKAYVDFNVLLLRVSKDREEYVQLSSSGLSILEELRDKVSKSDIAEEMKIYYLDHLESFARIYFQVNKKWKTQASFDVKYYRDDLLFYKVQEYARSGNIIATVRDMSDLEFLNSRNIEIIDTSNIRDYTVLDFKTVSHPKILWTGDTGDCTSYHTCSYSLLSNQERKELDQILETFSKMQEKYCIQGRLLKFITEPFTPEREMLPMFYCKELLEYLKKYREKYGS